MGLVALRGATAATPAPVGARRVAPILRELILLLQGPATAVKGTPALCGDTGPDAGTAAWYFGEGGCALEYPPSVTSMVTSVSLGDLKPVLSAPGVTRRTQELLDELALSVGTAGLALQDKLAAHTTAWELVYGMERTGERDPAWARQAAPLLCQAAKVLRSTSFRPEEAARLPANVGDLPRLAGLSEIADLAGGLVRHDPGIVEVVPSTDLHADLLFGRFTARVFVTSTRVEERDRLLRFLSDATTPYGALRALPQKFEGIQGILLLFFNVLTEDRKVLLTSQVAVWQQYTFEGQVPIDQPFAEAAKRIRFLTVEFQRDPERPGAEPRYRKVAANEMATQGLLNVKPLRAGAWVTTSRGQCLKCHVHQVATFDTHGHRQVAFAAPLVRPAADVVTPYYRANVEARLQRLDAGCAP
jgi:hypothetical protein